MKQSWVYILLCADNTFYTGCTTNIKNRIWEHKSGHYQGYTSKRLPVKLVWFEEFRDINEAIDMERRIKKWSKAKKIALIRGDFEKVSELARSNEIVERINRRKSVE